MRAKQQKNVPEIISHAECLAIINAMSGEIKLMTQLLYGSGLRLNDCLRLRVKDIDFNRKKITIRATYVFPSQSFSTDPRSGAVQRHHVSESMLQRAIKAAAQKAGITARVSPHTFRHCFATEYLQRAIKKHGDAMAALKTLQGYLGHAGIQTTMIYLHFIDHKVGSPLDD